MELPDLRPRIVLGLWVVLGVVCTASRTRAAEDQEDPPSSAARQRPSLYAPRWTPLEIQFPGLIGGSEGVWVLLPAGIHHRVGLAADLGLSLGGVDLAVGPGLLRPEFEHDGNLTRHEEGWSVAVQGLLYRTWPWSTPWLPSSTTYIGAEASAGYIMVRCWFGAMRPLDGRENAWIAIGGIGVGLP